MPGNGLFMTGPAAASVMVPVQLLICGLIYMQAGEYASVWTYAEDRSYTVAPQSSFSGTLLVGAYIGFGADKLHDLNVTAPGWTEIKGWTTAADEIIGLFNLNAGGTQFDPVTGRFEADASTTYFVSANIILKGCESGNFLFRVALNGETGQNSGIYAAKQASSSSALIDVSISGLVTVETGDYFSVWVYSSLDMDYQVSDHSGFSCVKMDSTDSAVATRQEDSVVIESQRWTEISEWVADNLPFFQLGNEFDSATGRYTATLMNGPTIFFASAQLVFTAGDSTNREMSIVTNGRVDTDIRLRALATGWLRPPEFAGVSGLLTLETGDQLSVWLQQNGNFTTISAESGFRVINLALARAFECYTLNQWMEVKSWKAQNDAGGAGHFIVGSGADFAAGRYTVDQPGHYLVTTQLVVEEADVGVLRVLIALNGLPDADNGLHLADSHPDPDFADFSVSGVISMEAGDFVSVWVYAHEDTSYSV
eukprot:COSAG03_NODE_2839_length_2419_cov_2.190517_1_plen_480_part_10